MWYFILALLFGNPSNTDTNDHQTVASAQRSSDETGGTGGKGPVRPNK
ncbi:MULTISPECIES: hypothetical protein [unclassified Sphingobacterium]|nr:MULTISPECIES: hypothetical protein [unclassified Sphingobacterium]MCS3557603.1 hypothetical protein [Sphingobacterium sp. JUb21]QQD16059.1 hypothetical protein JAZ75_11290 [Sphingobacterium sp. UDSM-2020]TCQ95462.1 hypothetical protein EDF66_1275 [Sphingobacterium sp. JUb20]